MMGISRKEAHAFYRAMGYDNEKEQMRFIKNMEEMAGCKFRQNVIKYNSFIEERIFWAWRDKFCFLILTGH